MTSLPTIGYRPGHGQVQLDVEVLVGTRLLVQGVSGSGKSTAIRGLLEQTSGHLPHLVIDREGEFATLRERFPYVLAGREGDVPATTRSAKLLVRRIVELGTSVVVDLSDLRLHEQREWVRLAFEELVHLPREHWRPLLVSLDEGHLFAPERGSGESVATQAVIDLATLGRKRGYCLVVATQRLSKLHKDCAAELLNKFIGYTDDVDLQRAGDQLGMTKEQRATLKTLEWGQFWAYGPAVSKQPLLVQMPKTTTSAPPRGQVRPPAPPAPAQIRKLLAQLQDLPKQAEDEARSVADLQRQVREREARIRQLERGAPAAPPAAPVVKVETKRVEVPVLKDGQVKRLETVSTKLVQVGESLVVVGREITAAIAKIHTNGHGARPGFQPVPARPPLARAAPAGGAGTRPAPRRPAEPVDGVSGPQQRILDSLAWLESVGIDRAERTQLALLAEASPTSSAYANNLGGLRTAGLIAYPGSGAIALTDTGRAAAAVPEQPPTTAELHDTLFRRLPGPQVKILRALIDAYPAAIDRDALAEQAEASATSSAFANNLGSLRSLGLIDYPDRGQVAAKPVLFLEGR